MLTHNSDRLNRGQREMITDYFLGALEGIVWRYRAQRPAATQGAADVEAGVEAGEDIHAEALTGEVAQQLALARAALLRHRTIHP